MRFPLQRQKIQNRSVLPPFLMGAKFLCNLPIDKRPRTAAAGVIFCQFAVSTILLPNLCAICHLDFSRNLCYNTIRK